MRFLPVVERELRMTARGKAAHRSRFLSALVGAFVLGAMTMTLQQSLIPSRIGESVFGAVVFLLTWFCLIGGVMTTFDSLSEEKRQGTLGLLFLTPLRSLDIILGKFAGATVTVIFGAIAAVPILTVTLAMGGVTQGELGRMALALLTILFFGAAAGLLISSFMEESSRALLAAVAFVVAWLLTIEAAEAVQNLLADAEIIPVTAFSPLRLPALADEARQAAAPWRFYQSLAAVQGVSWLFLLTAGRITSRTRRTQPRDAWLPAAWRRLPRRFARSRPTGVTPAEIARLETNPAAWLAERYSPHRRLLPLLTWGATLVIVGILAAGRLFDDLWIGPAMVAGFLINLFLKLWIGVAACQMFHDARRTGALELLLSTPLPPARIVSGHQEALRKIFEPMIWKVFAIQCLPIVLSCVITGFHGEIFWAVMFPICAFISLMLDLRAMSLLGLWNGLIHSKMPAALGRTVFMVLIIPWLILIVPCLGWLLFALSPIYAAIIANSAEEKFFNHFPRIVVEPGAFKNGKPIQPKRPPMPTRQPPPPPPPLNQ